MTPISLYSWTEPDIIYIKKWLSDNIGLEFTNEDAVTFALHLTLNQIKTIDLPPLKIEATQHNIIPFDLKDKLYRKVSDFKKVNCPEASDAQLISSLVHYCALILPVKLF